MDPQDPAPTDTEDRLRQQPGAIHTSQRDRTLAAVAHVSALGAFAGLPLVGPVVVAIACRHRPTVRAHAREAINASLSMAVYGLLLTVAAVAAAFTARRGVPVLWLVGLLASVSWVAATVHAAVRAWRGQQYRYPLTIRFLR